MKRAGKQLPALGRSATTSGAFSGGARRPRDAFVNSSCLQLGTPIKNCHHLYLAHRLNFERVTARAHDERDTHHTAPHQKKGDSHATFPDPT